MIRDNIQKAVALGQRLGQVFVATADRAGLPHVAGAGRLQSIADRHVEVAAWFCPGTVMNLQQNRQIALVVWEPTRDTGYQLIGEVEQIRDTAMLNGYDTQMENSTPLPQTERTLKVRIDAVLYFSQAPHSDVAEEG